MRVQDNVSMSKTSNVVKSMIQCVVSAQGWGETCSVQLFTICGQSGSSQSEGCVLLQMTNEETVLCHMITLSQSEAK